MLRPLHLFKLKSSRVQKLTLLGALGLCLQCQSRTLQGSEETKAELKPEVSTTAPATQQVVPEQLKIQLLSEIKTISSSGDPERRIDSLLRLLMAPAPVSTQAAFSISQLCSTAHAEAETALLIALTSTLLQPSSGPTEALNALSIALARCGTDRAETSLRRLLTLPNLPRKNEYLRAASLGLGELAQRNGRLRERTLNALIDSSEKQGDLSLIYPLSRLSKIPASLEARLLEVVSLLITGESSQHRRFGILAMAAAGASAAAPLAQILISSRFSGSERAAAAQALARLGGAGQKGLDKALAEMLLRGLPLKATQSKWLPLRATLKALESPNDSAQLLKEVAEMTLPSAKEPNAQAQLRRMTWLRCRSADLLAKTHDTFNLLLHCDPRQGYESQAAQLRVLDRSSLKGPRAERYRAFLSSDLAKIRTQAILMLATHNEYPKRFEALQAALQSSQTSDLSAAAQALNNASDLANRQNVVPVDIIKSLTESLNGRALPRQTSYLLFLALGRLATPEATSSMLSFCTSSDPFLRATASNTIKRLSNGAQKCQPVAEGYLTKGGIPADKTKASARPFVLEFETDLGPLKLHFTSKESGYLIDIFRKKIEDGEFEGLEVGHTKPGVTLSLGDQNGDGYEDRPTPLIELPLSPQYFGAKSFGLTAFAPGAESGWLFILVEEAPQLWGKKSQLGSAEGPLAALIYGDPLRNPRILEN